MNRETIQDISYKDNKLQVVSDGHKTTIDVFSDTINKRHELGVFGTTEDKIYINKKINDSQTLVVYLEDGHLIYYIHTTPNNPLGRLVRVRSRTLWINLSSKSLQLITTILIEDPFRIIKEDSHQEFYIANGHVKSVKLPIYHQKLSRIQIIFGLLKNVRYTRFLIQDLLSEEEDIPINSSMQLAITPDESDIPMYNQIFYPTRRYRNNTKLYYAPLQSIWVGNSEAVHIRRSKDGGLVLVRRPQEIEETSKKFRFLESYVVSMILYTVGKLYRLLYLPKINVYFEKFASKAEEGSYDVFLNARKNTSKTKQFFIIKRNSDDYNKVKGVPGVLLRDTLKAYLSIYCSSAFITTEAPAHVTSLRSNNRYLRLAIYKKKFIFLQHGVTYLKRHGAKSAYVAGKEAEPSFIVAGGDKEVRAISDMLDIPRDRILKTGLPIFDNIVHDHITQASPDIATVMLTWRPYEEHIEDYSKTTYYQYTKQVFNILQKYIPKENIRIVAHPKVHEALSKTDLRDSLWMGPISEVLAESKLLITDYSSVCYNSFYQGGGVIFYQPDLEKYESESGPLVPKDDEYIGPRVHTDKSLEKIITNTIHNGNIDLSKLHSDKYNANYQMINEFTDGKNVDRIIKSLQRLHIL